MSSSIYEIFDDYKHPSPYVVSLDKANRVAAKQTVSSDAHTNMADFVLLFQLFKIVWELCNNELYGTFAFIFTFSKDYVSRAMEKAALCIHAKTKAHISFAVISQLINVHVFAT